MGPSLHEPLSLCYRPVLRVRDMVGFYKARGIDLTYLQNYPPAFQSADAVRSGGQQLEQGPQTRFRATRWLQGDWYFCWGTGAGRYDKNIMKKDSVSYPGLVCLL